VLYRTIEAHWPAFRERAEEAGGLPRFVVREVEEYLRCGLLEHGCVRVGCERCGFEHLVAFSCKRRGFCPSCLGRRMADTALHLVERVFPEVPVRQWVCSLPWRLRVLLGYDKQLCAEVLEVFVLELSRAYKRRAKALLSLSSVDDALTGAVSVIQRGDSALRLNVHFHVIVLDGVYVRSPDSGELVFHALAAPSSEENSEVAARTAQRVQKVLARHGRTLDGSGESDAAEPLGEQLALAALCGAAGAGHDLTGDRAGEPLLRVVEPARARKSERVGESDGFNVHADVAVPARDRAQLERLCRYLCRPPIAQERLEETASGKLRYTLKRPWRDGTVALVLEPLDLLARVCALIPPLRFHMIRYHGVLSSHAKVRAEVVPHVEELPVQLPLFAQQDGSADRNLDVLAPEPRRKPWAWLLRHVFEIDVSTCQRCGGATRWLEAATKPDAIARLLAKHGLGPRPPPRPSPKGQLRLAFPKP
jgi:hypothetical protein